jgi:rhodanese-related sulfurtransferase
MMLLHLEILKKEFENGLAQIFDVRELDEWNEGHLKGAHLVPLSELRVGLEPENKDHSLKTYIYCRSGNRVNMAKPLLESMGFKEVIALREGFVDLFENGFITEE